MNRKHLILAAGALVLAGTLAACHTQHDPEEAKDRAAWMVERVSRELDLNDDQKARLDALKRVLLAARTEAMQQHETDRKELLALLEQPTLDRTRAAALVTAHTRAIEARTPEVIAAVADVYDSFTPEQQRKLRERIASHSDRHPWH